jgi:hypothetical protein
MNNENLQNLLKAIAKKSTVMEFSLNIKCTKIFDKGFKKLAYTIKYHLPLL